MKKISIVMLMVLLFALTASAQEVCFEYNIKTFWKYHGTYHLIFYCDELDEDYNRFFLERTSFPMEDMRCEGRWKLDTHPSGGEWINARYECHSGRVPYEIIRHVYWSFNGWQVGVDSIFGFGSFSSIGSASIFFFWGQTPEVD